MREAVKSTLVAVRAKVKAQAFIGLGKNDRAVEADECAILSRRRAYLIFGLACVTLYLAQLVEMSRMHLLPLKFHREE